MEDSDPKYMTVDEFNGGVKKWSMSIRRGAARNLDNTVKHNYKDWKKRTLEKLKRSLRYRFGKDHGIANFIRFNFSKQGIYLHYGVGRGYVRVGNSVVRGRTLNDLEKYAYSRRGYSNKEIKKKKHVYKDANGQIERKPIDWFDVEIKTGIKFLAKIAQEFYGDKAMKDVLDNSKKSLIDKK